MSERQVRIREDWPPGSNARLLAEREAQLRRVSLLVSPPKLPAGRPGEVTPIPEDVSAGKLLAELRRLAAGGFALPLRSHLGRQIGYRENCFNVITEMLRLLARRGALQVVFAERPRYAVRLLPEGTLLLSEGADPEMLP